MLLSSLLTVASIVGSALAFTATPFVPFVILSIPTLIDHLFDCDILTLFYHSASVPLAVRSPYASTWLPAGTSGSLGMPVLSTSVDLFNELIGLICVSWYMASVLDWLYHGVGWIRSC